MTVLAVRYESQATPSGRRFASKSRTAKMKQIQDRIERGEYRVDPQDVAGAILRRLMLVPPPPRG
jgi:anti-sigma28 factor (negative regulator of flagellin synthesis)